MIQEAFDENAPQPGGEAQGQPIRHLFGHGDPHERSIRPLKIDRTTGTGSSLSRTEVKGNKKRLRRQRKKIGKPLYLLNLIKTLIRNEAISIFKDL